MVQRCLVGSGRDTEQQELTAYWQSSSLHRNWLSELDDTPIFVEPLGLAKIHEASTLGGWGGNYTLNLSLGPTFARSIYE